MMARRCEELLGCYDPQSCILLDCWRDQIKNGSMDPEGTDCWSEEILSVFENKFSDIAEVCEYPDELRKVIVKERPRIIKK